MIFAAKTTESALITLLVAFTFNLDQPQWALLTVLIVSRPQSRLVLAKSFYRLIGTLIGAAVALLLVSLFAQERVLFLGALALWTASARSARNMQGTSRPTVSCCPAIPPRSSRFPARWTRVTRSTPPQRVSPKSAWDHRQRRDQSHRPAGSTCGFTLENGRRYPRPARRIRRGGDRGRRRNVASRKGDQPGDREREYAFVGRLRRSRGPGAQQLAAPPQCRTHQRDRRGATARCAARHRAA
jgi:hypothetical protein